MTAILEPTVEAVVLPAPYGPSGYVIRGHTQSGYNAELFYRVAHQIMIDPERWDQTSWAARTPDCGTTHCFAGWTAVLTGHQFEWAYEQDDDDWEESDILVGNGHVAQVAARLLGLNDDEASELFEHTMGHGAEQTDHLWDSIEWVTGGEVTYLGYRDWLAVHELH
jgi:hypothetical protein